MAITESIKNYTNIADIKNWFKNKIAPMYFDVNDINMYQMGIFGYVNEILGTVSEDSFRMMNLVKREFYPVSAEFMQSLYKMAVMQEIPLPMAQASVAHGYLLIPETEILKRGSSVNGTHVFVLDDNMEIWADNLQFAIDFPIKILSKKNGETWSHVVHYDIDRENSLNTSPQKYLKSITFSRNGARYLSFKVLFRQVSKKTSSNEVTTNSVIKTTTIDIPFNGMITNFEVFYKENDNSEAIQLKKLLLGSPSVKIPHCFYTYVNLNTLRLQFSNSLYFSPKFNSTIITDIYTTDGESGNFQIFESDIRCKPISEKYPYNNGCIVMGQISGGATGGKDTQSDEEFRQTVVDAYTTNKTIVTDTDLQIYFKTLVNDNMSKAVFAKRRDDVFARLFGAFLLFRDNNKNIVPANTLDIDFYRDEYDVEMEFVNRLILKPGSIIRYNPESDEGKAYKDSSISIHDDLDIYEKTIHDGVIDQDFDFIYTNPFLIAASTTPNVIGHYLTTYDDIYGLDISYINDSSYYQFKCGELRVKRNAILGEDFYKITFNIQQSTTDWQIDFGTNTTEELRAEDSGVIKSITYDNGCAKVVYKYDKETTDRELQLGTRVIHDNDTFSYEVGWNLNFYIGDKFQINDLLATRCPVANESVRIIGVFNGVSTSNHYITFTLEEVNLVDGIPTGTYTAWVKTDDFVTIRETVALTEGVQYYTGEPTEISVPLTDNVLNMYVFVKNPNINIAHEFESFPYVSEYTLANTYTQSNENLFDIMTPLEFIRGHILFNDIDIIHDFNFKTTITEVPLVKANWIKNVKNTKDLISKLYLNHTAIKAASKRIENNFSIDMKFFNTYGRSRYYYAGDALNEQILDRVDCTLKFKIKLSTLSSIEIFKGNFVRYVKTYIENFDNVLTTNSLFMMNLIADLKANFEEIDYLEWCGINDYPLDIQKIDAVDIDQLTSYEKNKYIPEFINVSSIQDDDKMTPQILVQFIQQS